jgi:rapamycin-insensitive companion of mTOR
MARTLIALVQWQDENIKRRAIDIIRLLAVKNIKLCVDVGGIKVLCNALIDPSLETVSDDIMYTLIALLNEPETRN